MEQPKHPRYGLDFSGTVADLGEGVTRWQVGDAVLGTGSGSFAEYRTAKQDALAAGPERLDRVRDGHTRGKIVLRIS